MTGDSRTTRRVILVAVLSIGIICIAFASIFVRVADAPALVKSAYRMGISSAVIIPYSLIFHRAGFRDMRGKDVLLSLLSGIFLAAHFAMWIASLDYTSVASSVIFVNTIPVWTALFGLVLGAARPSGIMWMCVALSVAGTCVISYGDISLSGKALFGDALALGGGMSAAFYIMCGREARKRLGLPEYVSLCYGAAAAILWLAALAMGYRITGFSATTWGALFGMAVLSQIIGHTSYNWVLSRFSAGFVGIMLLGESIGSAILAYFFFGEVPAPIKFAGFVPLLAAIVLAARDEGA